MKLPDINLKKITALSKKYGVLTVILLLLIIFTFNLIFIIISLSSDKVDEGAITAREEKINSGEYNQIIKKDNDRKTQNLIDYTQIKNPF